LSIERLSKPAGAGGVAPLEAAAVPEPASAVLVAPPEDEVAPPEDDVLPASASAAGGVSFVGGFGGGVESPQAAMTTAVDTARRARMVDRTAGLLVHSRPT